MSNFKPVFLNNIVTPKGFLGYAYLEQPRPSIDGIQPGKYSCTIWLPKSNPEVVTFVDKLRAQIKEIAAQSFPTLAKLSELKLCLKDGDKPNEDGEVKEDNAGCWVITAKSKNKPLVVGANPKIMFPGTPNPGDLGRLKISIHTWSQVGRGVSAMLETVQVIGAGRVIAGASRQPSADGFDVEESTSIPIQTQDGVDDWG